MNRASRKVYAAAWRNANRERMREHSAKYYADNKEKIKERNAEKLEAPNKPKNNICKTCGVTKEFSIKFFQKRDANKWKLDYTCRSCTSLKSQINITRIKYGISYEKAKQLRKTSCRICGSTERLHLDHCHKTGQLRSVLCSSCNNGLGCFKDDPDMMRAAALYVESFP